MGKQAYLVYVLSCFYYLGEGEKDEESKEKGSEEGGRRGLGRERKERVCVGDGKKATRKVPTQALRCPLSPFSLLNLC